MKALFKKQWFQFVCFVLIIAVGFGVYKFAIAGESKAKRVIDEYLEATKNGDEYGAIDADEVFIDVFDYEFLKEIESPKEKDTTTVEKRTWELVYEDKEDNEYLTFGMYKRSELNRYRQLYENLEVIRDEPDILEIWDGESYKDLHTFLYNVEIANEAGQKLFKKAEITVENGVYYNRVKEDADTNFYIKEIKLR